jgi:SAM-dependent methyltransferase
MMTAGTLHGRNNLNKERENMTIWEKYCVGKGIEIGASSYNSFGLDTQNVDVKDERYPIYEAEQMGQAGVVTPVDIVADAAKIPLPDESVDFVISSHVLEHLFDPIGALLEWNRVVKRHGIIFMIVPHKERTFDKDRDRTPLSHLIDDFSSDKKLTGDQDHTHVWITEDIIVLVYYMIYRKGMTWKLEKIEDVDSKQGNGFTIVIRKV